MTDCLTEFEQKALSYRHHKIKPVGNDKIIGNKKLQKKVSFKSAIDVPDQNATERVTASKTKKIHHETEQNITISNIRFLRKRAINLVKNVTKKMFTII